MKAIQHKEPLLHFLFMLVDKGRNERNKIQYREVKLRVGLVLYLPSISVAKVSFFFTSAWSERVKVVVKVAVVWTDK